MNPLEQYLNENKHFLKKEIEGDSFLWDKIKDKLLNQRNNLKQYSLRIAATITLLLALSTFIKVFFYTENTNTQLPLYAYSKEYGGIEKEYIKAIEYETTLLKDIYISEEYKTRFNSFLDGIKELDKAYKEYIEIIKKEGFNENMMMLIIEHYQRKLELLKSLQDELKKIKNHEKNYEQKKAALNI